MDGSSSGTFLYFREVLLYNPRHGTQLSRVRYIAPFDITPAVKQVLVEILQNMYFIVDIRMAMLSNDVNRILFMSKNIVKIRQNWWWRNFRSRRPGD